MKPVLLVNFKKKSGEEAKNIIDKLSAIKKKLNCDLQICIALQPNDAIKYSGEINFPVYIQDTFSEEKITSLNNYDLDSIFRIEGVIINHPDKKDSYQVISEKVRLARLYHLKSLMCATDIEEAIKLNTEFNPDFIGIECFINDNNMDFTTRYKDILNVACEKFEGKFLLGGGIKNNDDVLFAINSGASGVLVSGIILNSDDPDNMLRDLVDGVFNIENMPISKY